jgi:hypothetical protein
MPCNERSSHDIFIYVGLAFSYLEFVIQIGASCLLCEGPSVLDGLMWASRGHCNKCFLGDRSSGKIRVADSKSHHNDTGG